MGNIWWSGKWLLAGLLPAVYGPLPLLGYQ